MDGPLTEPVAAPAASAAASASSASAGASLAAAYNRSACTECQRRKQKVSSQASPRTIVLCTASLPLDDQSLLPVH